MRKTIDFLQSLGVKTNRLILIIPLSFIISLLNLAQPELLRRATTAITSANFSDLSAIMFIAVAVALSFVILTLIRDIYLKQTQNYYEKQLGERLVKTLFRTKFSVLSKKQFGEISTSVIRSSEKLVESISSLISSGSSAYFSLALTFLYMLIVQWQLALCILAYNLVLRFFAVFVEKKIKKNTDELNSALKQSGNNLSSMLRNMISIKIYSNRDFFKSLLMDKEKSVMKASWKNFVWQNGFQDFIWAFSKMAEFVVIYIVGSFLISNELSSISVLISFIFANDLFTIGINSLSSYMSSKANYLAYKDSIMEILDEQELESEPVSKVKLTAKTLRFENVSFSYGEKPIFNNLNFALKKGEKILLKGENGHGKSTLLKLVCGLLRPDSGHIFYDNTDINSVNISSISECCRYISQKNGILDGSINSNISLSNSSDEVKILSILNKMAIDNIKDSNPFNLSSGEAQRVNIARALYKNESDIVLFDEIFSNIDPINRALVVKAVEETFKDKILIFVSHENVGINFDRVLCLANGTVKEEQL